MKNIIQSHYGGILKEAFWLLGIASINIIIAFIAFFYWGETGLGILLILLGFSAYQLILSLKTILNKQAQVRGKTGLFEQNSTAFIHSETEKAIAQDLAFEKYKNTFMILFLVGILCLLMGAFGNWGDMSVGLGASLALQAAIMLILNLLADFRNSFYLQRLKKFNQ